MTVFDSAIQRAAVLFARAHKELQQFGQANDDEVWNGASACTHLGLQFITLFVLGRKLTLNQVNRLAGMPANATTVQRGGRRAPRGMRPTEVAAFAKAVKLPYQLVSNPTWAAISSGSKRGPVLYGMVYGSAPTRRGTVYHGTKAAAPFAIKNGATQLTGAELMFHAVIYLGEIKTKAYRKDPNHGSPARTERPAYDVITTVQARKEYEDVQRRLGHASWALIPTRKVR